ncbi:hypothetical protein [Streptomyces pseudogriseolus]|uniref:hypothetical protein n=1 Tax=Streptomyces pseudogriseolus TaxID=36817 RepID=UPI00347A7E84
MGSQRLGWPEGQETIEAAALIMSGAELTEPINTGHEVSWAMLMCPMPKSSCVQPTALWQ